MADRQRDQATLLDVGSTFLCVDPARERHLWVAVATDDASGDLLCFNLTSRQDGCDETCVIQPGEHRWVTHETVVTYMRGRAWPLSAAAQGLLRMHDPVSPALLERIRRGALASEFTKLRFKRIIAEALGEA